MAALEKIEEMERKTGIDPIHSSSMVEARFYHRSPRGSFGVIDAENEERSGFSRCHGPAGKKVS